MQFFGRHDAALYFIPEQFAQRSCIPSPPRPRRRRRSARNHKPPQKRSAILKYIARNARGVRFGCRPFVVFAIAFSQKLILCSSVQAKLGSVSEFEYDAHFYLSAVHYKKRGKSCSSVWGAPVSLTGVRRGFYKNLKIVVHFFGMK